MEEMIGYSAYNLHQEAYEYNEDECFIADSIESLSDFIKGGGFFLEDFKAVIVDISDIMNDYAVSSGRFCMEQEALKRFEKEARSSGISYSREDYCEGLVNVKVVLPRRASGMKGRDAKAGLAPKTHMEDPLMFVTFSSQKNRFLLVKRYCSNPSCTANDISLTFVEVDERLMPVANPLHFTIWLDLDTWKEIKPPERPESISRLAKEFLNDLTEEMKVALFSEVRSMRKDKERLAKCQLNPRDVRKGVLVSFTHIVSEGGSITQHGKEVSFRFLHKGREYLVEDLYCPDPDCQCKKVHLHFFELTRELSRPARIIECFMAEITFKGRMKIFELFTCNSQDADDLMEVWKVRYPDALGVLKERYETIKEIGKRSLQVKGFSKIPESSPRPVTKERKIGRNEPCPCGSVKKYKKCCGAG